MRWLIMLSVVGSVSVLCVADETRELDKDAHQCNDHMKEIYAAVQKYRKDHKDLPKWMSDLVDGGYLKKDVLTCPVVARTGRAPRLFGIRDPKLSTSYIYEFCDLPVPGQIWGGSKRTMKEWKQRQMGLVGSDVPILRCHHHEGVLNLSFGGELFQSGTSWEELHADKVPFEALAPGAVFEERGEIEIEEGDRF